MVVAMIRSFARRALPVVAAAFVACAIIQVFLAGLGVFSDPKAFLTHAGFGYLFVWLTLAILVLALVGREPRAIVGLSVLLLVQFALQSIFVAVRTDMPTVAALHPLNGFLILLVGIVITRAAWATRAVPAAARSATAPAGAAPSATPGPG
jgi:hypothetical protein